MSSSNICVDYQTTVCKIWNELYVGNSDDFVVENLKLHMKTQHWNQKIILWVIKWPVIPTESSF